MENIIILIEEGGAKPDLNTGELVKDDEEENQEYDSLEEKYFMEAFKNTCTPL
jgi:hypothetical protein